MSKSTSWYIVWDSQMACYQIKEQSTQSDKSLLCVRENNISHQWLEQIASFTFYSKDGGHFTALKERRKRGGAYWIAYRKIQGKLKRKYIGIPEKLTLRRLEQIATLLAQQESHSKSVSSSIVASTISNQRVEITPESSVLQEHLLATKFFIPTSTHKLISRPELDRLLTEGIQHQLTLVSATAGFGKTTLLAQWINSSATNRAKHMRITWLSLDERDNNAIRFWLYVLMALDRSDPGIATPALQLLQVTEKPGLEYMLTTLINTLSQTTNTYVLILDDFYLISEPVIHLSINFLLEHQPPQLHLVILSRIDPPLNLSRLRAHGQMVEVHTEQLRLNQQDVKTFLKDVMKLDLAPELVQKIITRTEGWLAGLQLLSLSLQNRSQQADLLKPLEGDHRYILDYLTEEVLQQLPPNIRRFLLQTSILKRLSASLCDAVVEQEGSQSILEYLEHANAFLIPLDEKRHWYRYHTLFADTLHTLLEQEEPATIPLLHLKASQWYARHNILVEAVQHALHAHAWQQVANLIEPFTEALLNKQYESIWRHCEEVPMMLRWLHQLPPEIIHTRPQLSLYYARSLLIAGHLREAERWIQTTAAELLRFSPVAATVEGCSENEKEKLQSEVLALHAIIATYRSDNQLAQEYHHQASQHIGEQDLFQQSLVAFAQGMIAFNAGLALPATQQMLRASSLMQTIGIPGETINYLSLAASFLHVQGQLYEAQHILQQALNIGIQPGCYPLAIVGVAYIYQADIFREWNQLDRALELVRQGIRFIEQTKYTLHIDIAYTILARIHLSRGEIDDAHQVLEQIKRIPTFVDNPERLRWLTAIEQVRIFIAQGKLDRAISWGNGLEREAQMSSLLSREREEIALIRLAIATCQPAQALARMEPLLAQAQQARRQDHVIELHLLQAIAYQMQQDETAALSILAAAVQLARPESYVRRFVDEGPIIENLLGLLRDREQKQGPTSYLDIVLDAFPPQNMPPKYPLDINMSPRQPSQLLIEPLSAREQEVLQLIAHGTSNQEIARRLTLSINTVKSHASNIFIKLGASNRTQAVDIARTLGLLSRKYEQRKNIDTDSSTTTSSSKL